MQNIYTVLDKIRFDERVNEERRILKQCKNTDNAILSDFVFKNFCFGLIRDFYDEILKENVANNVAKPNSQHLKAKNDTQTDLRTIGELQAEINRLREENAKMFELLEMVARGITLMCDTEDVIRITSAVKKFCIAKRESEE